MSRAEQLKVRLGRNMNESLGVRVVTQDTAPGSPVIPTISPDDGRTRDRLAGHIELDRIIPDPDQPRKTFSDESINQLSESLKRAGQLQPIRVRWNEQLAKWVIIAGERRYRAALQAGFKTIACVFVDRPLTESEIRQESLIENLLREDLRPIEAAEGYRQLIDINGWTVQQVADALNVSKGTVSKALALLKLPADIQAQVEEGLLSPSSAYEVSRLADAGAQRDLADRIVTGGLKRDEAGEAVGKSKKKPVSSKVIHVEGAKVTITVPKKTIRTIDLINALRAALAQLEAPESAAA